MALWSPPVVMGIVLLAGCSPFGGGSFACAEDGECAAAMAGGRCEADGRCSFPDPGCDSGRRYGDLSGPVAGTCVGATGDAGIDAGDDAAPDAFVTPFCDDGDPTLVGCWQFEDTLDDASGDGNHGTSTSATFAAGKLGQGLVLDATTVVAVPDSASLSPTRLTIEAWIRPTQLPVGTDRMGILDNNGQYGFFIHANRIDCSVTAVVSAPVIVATNTWTHVACTYDGTAARIYIDGAEAAMIATSGDLGPGDTSGTVIGANSPGGGNHLVGMIDQVRVWNVGRTAQEVCAASDATVCP